jgi:hypothetical protein
VVLNQLCLMAAAEMGRPLFSPVHAARFFRALRRFLLFRFFLPSLTGSLLGQVQRNAKPKPRVIVVTTDELEIINNALNEVCNGIHLEGELDTRMGCTVEDARWDGILERKSSKCSPLCSPNRLHGSGTEES